MAGEGAAAGAAIGTAIMPGIGTAIGGLAGSFLDSGAGGGGGASGYTPRTAEAAVYGSGLDGSGWNVNFSGMQTNGSNKEQTAPSAMDSLGLSGGGGGISPLMIVGLVAVVGLVLWKKSKSAK
jgi:hypothetical protein